MVEPLSGLEIAGIIQHCEDELKRSIRESNRSQTLFHERYSTPDELKSDVAIGELTDMHYSRGYRLGINYVLRILEMRKLP